MGIPMGFAGVQMCGRMGVVVSGCLFFVCTRLPLPACLPAGLGRLPALGACLPVPWVPACLPRVQPLRTNDHAHAPTCALEHGLSVCGLSQYFGSSSLLLVSVDGALTESGNCSNIWNVSCSSARCTTGGRRGTRTSIRQSSLLSSFAVLSELIVFHNASALAHESATLLPKWKDLGPLRLPCPRQRQELCSVSCKTRLYFIR